ncbi:MAG: hypothetical protein ACK4OP_00150 [Gemmobacter sp.]
MIKDRDNEGFARDIQMWLATKGFDPGRIDGWAGPATRAAWARYRAGAGQFTLITPPPPAAAPPAPAAGTFNAPSEDRLRGVHPVLVALARAVREEAVFDVIEGLRSAERQRQLVAQGASRTFNSRHLTGHAIDVWPIDPETGRRVTHPDQRTRDRLLWEHLKPVVDAFKRHARSRGVMIDCGFDWGWDAPHIELNRAAYPA